MPNIPYPNVPAYPGVPPLVRGNIIPSTIAISLGAITTLLASAVQTGGQWGIFETLSGAELGLISSQSIIQSLSNGPFLSTNSLEFMRETRISDFPIERGSFASYNKVQLPANPVVTLALSGQASDRTYFLRSLDAACIGTTLYDVVTPEFVYSGYSIERYNLIRRAERGATMLWVEVSLKEIRQVSAAYSTVQTPINQPQNPNAVPQSNSGLVQPQTPPPQSTLKSLMNLFPSLGGN
jgi:hypothetical protein